MRPAVMLFACLLALAGCETETPQVAHWSKPGATYDDFLKARGECIAEARKESGSYYLAGAPHPAKNGVSASIFIPCMAAHGYANDPKGFAPQQGDEIEMSQ